MSNKKCLDENFLDKLIKDEVSVSIFLVNGIKLHGVVSHYDEHVVMLKNTITQMVFKHAISTVVPAKIIEVDG